MPTPRNTARRRGQALLEYALAVAGGALVCAVFISLVDQRLAETIGTTVALVPGAHATDNGRADGLIAAGNLVETNQTGLDLDAILQNSGSSRLGKNVFGDEDAVSGLIIDPR